MNIDKRILYIIHLYAALHTLSIKVYQLNYALAKSHPLIKTVSQKVSSTTGEIYYTLQLNPNKILPGTMIKSYSEFEAVLEQILKDIEADVKQVELIRVDLSLNSDYEEDYKLFKKLNKALICGIAEANKVQNCYQSQDLWTCESLSIAIKSNVLECENYNKFLESKGQVDTKNRLELRSLNIRKGLKYLPSVFKVDWFERLDTAVEHFEAVQQHYNRELVKIWKEDREKKFRDRKFKFLTTFLSVYSECIFTSKQMEALLTEIGVKNPKNTIKKFKENYNIEFFSLKDLKIIVKGIKKVTRNYFKN